MPKKKGALNDKRKVFAQEYTVDLNSTQAAKRAGYSERSAYSTGNELKTNPEVKAEIQRQMDQRSERTGITADYVLSTVKDTIERCRQAEPVYDSEGNPTGEYKFDSRGVLKGCEMLGKHIKLWDVPPKIEINLNVNTMTDEEIEEEIRKLESEFA